MADKLVPSRDDTSVVERYKDMGDGSWAKVSGAAAAVGAAGYPAGATPLQSSSGSVANATATATLAAAAGKTTYISGFQLVGAGATAAGITGLTITGLKDGPLTYVVVVPAGAQTPFALQVQFNPPLPASAVNTAIGVSVPGVGAGSLAVGLSAQGFQV